MSRRVLWLALAAVLACDEDDESITDAGPVDAARTADASRDLDATSAPDVTTPPRDAEPEARDAGSASCAIEQVYKFAFVGGNVAYSDAFTLSPGGELLVRRTTSARANPDAGVQDCKRQLGECGGALADAKDLNDALGSADVSSAWGTAPNLFGVDSRPWDGVILVVERADGKVIELGDRCLDEPGCRQVTSGLASLQLALGQLMEENATACFAR